MTDKWSLNNIYFRRFFSLWSVEFYWNINIVAMSSGTTNRPPIVN